MKAQRLIILSILAMTAFAANSLLCRLALKHAQIDAASFTSIRILSGAAALWLILRLQDKARYAGGSWISAFVLFTYAAAFSFAYISLPAGTGALLLFGAVQMTMIFYGLLSGERLSRRQSAGLAMAVSGLVAFLLPGISTPPLIGTALMLMAGVAWGIYSVRGKGASDSLGITAGNFLRAVPLALGLNVILMPRLQINAAGIVFAILSGAVASGIGYAIWYQVVRAIKTTSAAIMQLSVPVIAAIGGMVLLGEVITLQLYISALAILGGIAMVMVKD